MPSLAKFRNSTLVGIPSHKKAHRSVVRSFLPSIQSVIPPLLVPSVCLSLCHFLTFSPFFCQLPQEARKDSASPPFCPNPKSSRARKRGNKNFASSAYFVFTCVCQPPALLGRHFWNSLVCHAPCCIMVGLFNLRKSLSTCT